jgi:hypothetical protein
MQGSKLKIFSRILFSIFALGLIAYISFLNIAPFGSKIKYSFEDSRNSIQLGPPNRFITGEINGEKIYKQISDVVYFNTKIKNKFTSAKVRILFINKSNGLPIYFGFQDQELWHYETQLVDAPIINNLNWNHADNSPSLFQKNINYDSYEHFLDDPPKDAVIGIYNFDDNVFRFRKIPGYTPQEKETIIDTPLRGKVTFYVYSENEPFKLWIKKQDLNYYDDPDIVKIKVYKEEDVVYESTIDDDGISNHSGESNKSQEAYIANPGPGLPEPGVYKVIIETNGDTVVTQIKTNMNKIVFNSPLFPVSNHEVYPKIVNKTFPNKIISDALVFSSLTYHPQATQSLQFSDLTLDLKEIKKEESIKATKPMTEIIIPKSDVVLNGLLGYFAFEEAQFFRPTPLKLLPIDNAEEAETSDYIISNYIPSKQDGDWSMAELNFDLDTAYIKNNQLNWMIRVPQLNDSGSEVIIKSIDVELYKEPIIK